MTDKEFPNLNGYYINFQLLTQKLKEIAAEKGMTQSELAAGITPRDHLNKILNGKQIQILMPLYQLCNKLHVDIKLLIEQCYYNNYGTNCLLSHEMKKCTTAGDYDRLETISRRMCTFNRFSILGLENNYILSKRNYSIKKIP